MSSISAGTATGTALVSTGDTTGALQLQVNGTTPSITLAANGSIGVGSTPGYGTSGQVLTSAGTGSAPSWATPAGGGIVTIASGSFPAASVLDIISIPATYAYLMLQITGVSCTAAARTLVQVSTNNGSSFDTTAVNYADVWISTATVSNPSVATMVYANSQQQTADINNVTLRISGYQGGVYAEYRSRISETTGVNEVFGHYAGSTSAINALRVLWDAAGNFDAGTYALYGVA